MKPVVDVCLCLLYLSISTFLSTATWMMLRILYDN